MAPATIDVPLPTVVRQTLTAFVSGVRERFGARVASIRLFGSYARGEAREDSDVDCLVLLDRVDPEDERAIIDLAADLIWQIGGAVISPLTMPVGGFDAWKGRERRAALEIEREGISL